MTLRPLDDGDFTGTVGTLRDVSRQHRRQELLNGLIERSREMMAVTDKRAVSELVVSTAVEVFGLDLAVLRVYDADEDALVPVVTSTGAEEVLGERPAYGPTEGPVGTAFTEDELVVEEDLPDRSGSDVTAVDSGAYLPIGDRYILSLGHSSDDGLDDVTRGLLEVLAETATAAIDRVTREEHLRQYEAIVEAAEEALFTVDDNGRFTLVTRPFARLLGSEREALVGRYLDTVLETDMIEEPLAGDGPIVVETALLSNGDRHYLLRTAPYDGNSADRAFVLLTDVTEVKRRGTHLKVLHRLLRHNLRNRTSLIRGHAEQLAQYDLPAGAQADIEKILSASDALVDASETSRSVQRVLGFDPDIIARVPANEALDRFRTDVAGSIDSSETDVTVSVTTDDSLPFSEYLVLALRELVENAVEHDPASEVEVVASETDAGVEVSVSDDGTGIPEHQWDLLTGDQEITQLQHGDGLGLWLVKWTTDRHGGRLRLDKADEDGTRVTLVFPTEE